MQFQSNQEVGGGGWGRGGAVGGGGGGLQRERESPGHSLQNEQGVT